MEHLENSPEAAGSGRGIGGHSLADRPPHSLEPEGNNELRRRHRMLLSNAKSDPRSVIEGKHLILVMRIWYQVRH